MLLVLKDDSGLRQYHRAHICSLLATYGDLEDIDIGKFALECIHLCHEIINMEGLHPERNARQPFDDLMLDARAVLKMLREEEAADQSAITVGLVHHRQSCQEIHTTAEGHIEGYGDEFEEDDEIETGHSEDSSCEDCEEYESEEADEYEEEHALVGASYAAFEDEMEALIETEKAGQIRTIYVNSSLPKSPDPDAVENCVAVPGNFEVREIQAEEEDTLLECEVDIQEARLVQVFVMFLVQNCADMEPSLQLRYC